MPSTKLLSLSPRPLDPDPKLLEMAEEAGLTEIEQLIYSSYVEYTMNNDGVPPSMNELARHLHVQGFYNTADPSRVSSRIRTAQARAMMAGWTPRDELKVDEKVAQRNLKEIEKKLQNQVSTFVITWAQNATPVHLEFLESLHQYCKHRGAKLIVIAGRYKNPTSIWSKKQRSQEYWAEELKDHLVEHRFELNKNLVVMGDIKTQPTAELPLSGFESITQDKSGIFGHAKVQLTSIATPQNKWPKLLTTTGAVTKRNYIDAKAGKKGEFHHTFGATVVEVQGDLFHMRQINACDDGSFIDLDTEYTPKGHAPAKRPLGLVLGDLHTEFIDPDCEEAIFGPNGLLDFFNPEKVVIHDWFDGYSGSHHHRKALFTQIAKHRSGRNDVRGEIMRTFDRTKEWLRDGIEFNIVQSNHNEHLTRWLQETNPLNDLQNIGVWAEIVHRMDADIVMGDTGAEFPNPLQVMWEAYVNDNRLRFLTRQDTLIIGDIDCSHHGDQGANGSRGGARAYAKIGTKSTSGHGHSPEILHGHHRVGTNCVLDMEYVSGLSSWLHTDEVIYANGKRSLIHKFNGNWRAIRRRGDSGKEGKANEG